MYNAGKLSKQASKTMTQQRTHNRQRERRRRNRYAAVLPHPGTRTQAERSSNTQQIEPRSRPFRYRLVSGGIALVMLLLLAYFLLSDDFYVDGVQINGLRYLRNDEIATVADLDGLHVFWLSADAVRERVLRAPSVADVEVDLGWPPNLVTLDVDEREPALLWEQEGTRAWVDIQGRLMAERAERNDLLQIVTDNASAALALDDGLISQDVVLGALQLQELLADVSLLTYDAVQGLGFVSPEGWDVWLGVGTGMPEKLRIYETIVETVRARNLRPTQINIVNPDNPYYTYR